MNHKLISIIVPIYNTEEYLRKCIDSLVNQSYDALEIVLVNDGSTDGSLDICREYEKKHPNIRVISQLNKGVSSARNHGMLASKGEFVTFVDSDDELLPDAIDLMYELICAQDADVVSAAIASEDARDYIGTKCTYTVSSGEKTVMLAMKDVSTTACAKLFKKKAIKDILFEDGRQINEDGFFVFECYMRRIKVVECDRIVYLYAKRQNSASRVPFSNKFLDMLYFLERKKEILGDAYPQYRENMRILEVRTYLNLLQLICNSSDNEYCHVEKVCKKIIKANVDIDTSDFMKYEKRLFHSVCFRIYPLYKFAIRKLRK